MERTVVYKGIEFILGRSRKFDKDFDRVVYLLKQNTLEDQYVRMELLNIYQTSYHEKGKIETIMSFDSSCSGCEFCAKMRKAGENDPLIICNYCYDFHQESYKIFVANRHKLNLLIFSSVEFTVEELKTIHVTEENRGNSSGETPNKTYAINILNSAYAHPDKRFAHWAKNTHPIVAACDEIGKPENLVLVQSSIRIGIPDKKARYFDYVFTVYPDKKSCAEAIKNGASPCNGLKCIECKKKCYYATHTSDQIAEVLRGVSKEKSKVIMDEYNSRKREVI